MKTRITALLLALLTALTLTACGTGTGQPGGSGQSAGSGTSSAAPAQSTGNVATSADMAEVTDVVTPDMTPVPVSDLKDGTYEVAVDSSSSMFRVERCALTVAEGKAAAKLTMGGTGYLYLYPGTAEEAAAAAESDYIPFEEEDGKHTFTLPVEALDAGVPCAAFSRRKELWYDRTLVFRADSLPADALAEGSVTAPESLHLADGTYTVEVALEGGSGRASVTSPAKLTVSGDSCTAEIEWSSPNYDYMKVDGEQYLPVNTEGNSVFAIPVSGFDYKMPVVADTTAMSQPYEIDYTLYFDSATIQEAK